MLDQVNGRRFPAVQPEVAQGRSNTKVILSVVAVLAVLQAVAATDVVVGGSSQKWDYPPATNANYYDTWSAGESFAPGDNLVFEYMAGAHDVQVVSQAEYSGCSVSTGKTYASGNDVIPLPTAGDYYFICTFPGHCESGVKLSVTVKAAAANPPPFTPVTPPPDGSGTPNPASAPTPSPAAVPVVAPISPPVARTPPPAKAAAPAPVVKAPVTESRRKHVATGLIGGLCAGFVAAALVLALLIFVFRKKGCFEKHGHKKFSIELPDCNTSRHFSYRELSSFTKNFSDSELLSSGGFGDVFKGTLPSGALVAVKRIKSNKKEGEESFLAEATSLRQIRHRNLLQLRGWCQAKEGLLLVYDFMCNGSLDRWIYRNPSEDLMGDPSLQAQGLSWNVRWSILSGVASGLAYLHEEWVQCVLHRDIKASNVLLDAGFNAYLGDFGLARLVDHDVMHKTTLLAGTLGYMAPEMQYTGRATTKTDVYAYGILLLEVVCGRRALLTDLEGAGDVVLVDSVWRAHEAGDILRVADPRLFSADDDYDSAVPRMSGDIVVDKMTIVKVLQLGLLCCLPPPGDRPSMRFVRQWFQSGAMEEVSGLPDTKPQSGHYDVNSKVQTLSSSSGSSSSQSRSRFTPDSSRHKHHPLSP